MKTVKYILINIEMFLILISIVLGIGAAESSMWLQSILFLFGPFAWGYITDFNKQIHFCEVYSRAWSISLKSNC